MIDWTWLIIVGVVVFLAVVGGVVVGVWGASSPERHIAGRVKQEGRRP